MTDPTKSDQAAIALRLASPSLSASIALTKNSMLSLKLSVKADRTSSFWLATETASAATGQPLLGLSRCFLLQYFVAMVFKGN